MFLKTNFTLIKKFFQENQLKINQIILENSIINEKYINVLDNKKSRFTVTFILQLKL